jgi:hypothetical protein
VSIIVGCKVAVIVVEGGEVQSTGSGTCVAGTICIVDVTDPNFYESFTAIPDSDWYFHKWNSGDKMFCGGSTEPSCTLSFQGYEDSKAVGDMVATSEMFYIMPIFKQFTDIIAVDGKQWYQVDLFRNLSWSDIDAVCPHPDGVCSGLLNGYDMTGWTWASVDDVYALFNGYIGDNVLGPQNTHYGDRTGQVFERFLADGWRPTFEGPDYDHLVTEWRVLLRDEVAAAREVGYATALESRARIGPPVVIWAGFSAEVIPGVADAYYRTGAVFYR